MSRIVIDASVGFKWCVLAESEPLAAEADQLLDSLVMGGIEVLVPDLFWAEIGNILWKYFRRQKATLEACQTALASLQNMRLMTRPSADLVPEALEIAAAYGRTVYDSLYIALAQRKQTNLITADEKLANALALYLPVKWLGALPLG